MLAAAQIATLPAPAIAQVVVLPTATRLVLAAGAWFKNTLCVTRDGQACISRGVGDLDNPDACRAHESIAQELLDWLGEKPQAIAHDLHPDFHSSRHAAALAAQLQVPLIGVQHHHAHIAAIAAEHGHDQPLLGLALDGVGLGTDDTAWGGELLLVNGAQFQRLGHLQPLPLPGGDRAAREPWRMAAAALHLLGRTDEIARRYPQQAGATTVAAMLQRGLNCPASSSMGRYFDAAAGLLGVCDKMEFEAQAAIDLERLAAAHGPVAPLAGGYAITPSPSAGEGWGDGENAHIVRSLQLPLSPIPLPLSPTPLPQGERGLGCLDLRPLLAALADCNDAGYGAALFHATLAAALADWVAQAAITHGFSSVALGGGCFLNQILNQTLQPALAARGMRVLTARQLPPGDSAISLGQAWVALHQLKGH